MNENILTLNEHQKILDDADTKIEMLSSKQLDLIATKLNGWVNIPFVSEKKEQIVFVKIVKKVDRFIYKNLPNELYEVINDSLDGVSISEAELIEERLSSYINRYINIPYLTERMEQKVFEFILGIIISALVKGKNI